MFEKEITINGVNPIYGTLAIPQTEGKSPAILILPGSGPLDRNGNDRKGKIQTNLYKNLAHYFTKLGFVTLRYDKIGTGKRAGDVLTTGLSDLIADAKQAMTFLKQQTNVDHEKIILCGHSEGTIHATALAETMDPAGLMLLAGGVDNLIEALKKQRQLAYRELLAKSGFQGWLNRKLKIDQKGEKQTENLMKKMLNTDKDVVKIQLFFKQPAKYFREHSAFDARAALNKITCPVFAIQGDKDPLVDNDVLAELAGLVQGENEYHIIKNMEHTLKEQIGPKDILNYQKHVLNTINQPFHPDALEKIADWLSTNFKDSTSQARPTETIK
ncbi:alpha/beta hydrolase [Bacillus marasmi]|uniref:alpha/beta hydrolase n=1 Tax=Bacillus marasmi TaxID=1926279 RepID=UPI0011C7733F|nr:alpha/beta fold hydrolase [Bacillus marasmi]